jgi:hypothetical protein
MGSALGQLITGTALEILSDPVTDPVYLGSIMAATTSYIPESIGAVDIPL